MLGKISLGERVKNMCVKKKGGGKLGVDVQIHLGQGEGGWGGGY